MGEPVSFGVDPLRQGARKSAFDVPGMLRRLASEPASESTALRPLDELIALQKANGSRELTEEVATFLGIPLADLEKPISSAGGDLSSARRAWATALALA